MAPARYPPEQNWTGFEGGRADDVCWQGDAGYFTIIRDGRARSGDNYARMLTTTPIVNAYESAWARITALLGTSLPVGEVAQTRMRVYVRLGAPVGTSGCYVCGVFVNVGQRGHVALDTAGHVAAVAGATRGSYSADPLRLFVWYRVDLTLTVTQLNPTGARTDTVAAIYSAAGHLVARVTATETQDADASLPLAVTIGNTHPSLASTFHFEFDDWYWCSAEMDDVATLQWPTATRVLGVPPAIQGGAADWAGALATLLDRPRTFSAGQSASTLGATSTFRATPLTGLEVSEIAGVVLRTNFIGTPAHGAIALLLNGVESPDQGGAGLTPQAIFHVDPTMRSVAALEALEFGVRLKVAGSAPALDNIYLEVLAAYHRTYQFQIRHQSLQIHDAVGEAPTRLTLTVERERPPGSAAVRIGLEPDTWRLAATIAGSDAAPGGFDLDAEPLLFEGVIQTVEEHYDGLTTQLAWDCTAIDHVYELNKLRPVGSFDQVAAHVVIETIMGTYAPGFDLAFVQQIAVRITIAFDGALELSACLSAIATQLGSCHWYLDRFALHFYHTGVNDGDVIVDTRPAPPGPLTVGTTGDPLTVLGGFTGWSTFCLTFVYSNGLESQPSDLLLFDVDDTHACVFTDLPIGAPFFGLPVVKRYLYQHLLFGGYRLVFIIPDNTSTTYRRDETAPLHPRTATPRLASAPAPTTAPTVAVSIGNTNALSGGTQTQRFSVSYVYTSGRQSDPGPFSASLVVGGTVDLLTWSDLPIGPPTVEGDVVLYRLLNVETAFMVGVTTYTRAWVPNNVDVTREENWVPGGPVHPVDDWFYPNVPVRGDVAPTFGPSLEADLDQPDPLTDDSATLIHDDPPLTSSEDDTQLRTRVMVRGAAATLTTATTVGSTGFTVAPVAIFDPGGGQVLVAGEVFAYESVASGSLGLAAGATVGRVLPIGTPVSLWVQCDDYQAQADLGEREAVDGVPSDGVREFTIVAPELDSVQDCLARGYAELTLFARPILTVTYGTFDPKTRAGRLVPIALTHPPLVHAGLLIQEMTIDRIDVGPVPWRPRRTVTASSVRFTLDDLLRKVQLSDGS